MSGYNHLDRVATLGLIALAVCLLHGLSWDWEGFAVAVSVQYVLGDGWTRALWKGQARED